MKKLKPQILTDPEKLNKAENYLRGYLKERNITHMQALSVVLNSFALLLRENKNFNKGPEEFFKNYPEWPKEIIQNFILSVSLVIARQNMLKEDDVGL